MWDLRIPVWGVRFTLGGDDKQCYSTKLRCASFFVDFGSHGSAGVHTSDGAHRWDGAHGSYGAHGWHGSHATVNPQCKNAIGSSEGVWLFLNADTGFGVHAVKLSAFFMNTSFGKVVLLPRGRRCLRYPRRFNSVPCDRLGMFYHAAISLCWIVAFCIWWLVAHGSWLLAGGCWLLARGWWLLAGGWWLVVVGSWLVAVGW